MSENDGKNDKGEGSIAIDFYKVYVMVSAIDVSSGDIKLLFELFPLLLLSSSSFTLNVLDSIDATFVYVCVSYRLYACTIDCAFVCFCAAYVAIVKIVCEYDTVTDLYSFDFSFNNIIFLFLISLSFLFFTSRKIALLLFKIELNCPRETNLYIELKVRNESDCRVFLSNRDKILLNKEV